VALRHRPALLATSAATGVCIGLVASAPVLFVSSVGGGAVQKQYSLACPASTGITIETVRYRVNPVTFDLEPFDPVDLLAEGVAGDPTFAARGRARRQQPDSDARGTGPTSASLPGRDGTTMGCCRRRCRATGCPTPGRQLGADRRRH
jgi:hypothetical protein